MLISFVACFPQASGKNVRIGLDGIGALISHNGLIRNTFMM